MDSIYMIFTALATTALAQGSIECSFSKPTGGRCFGAVGQLLIFHLPLTASKSTEFRLKKDKNMVLKIAKNHTVTPYEEYLNKPELLTNGTLKVGLAMKTHSGEYILEEYGSNGALVKKVKMPLEIQAPVSKPAVSQICFSREQKNISCSSEGDGAELILTLDDHLLMNLSLSQRKWTSDMQPLAGSKTEDKSSVSSQLASISLHGQLTGNLKCHVWNKVSRDETVIHLTSCEDFSSFPVAAVAVIASAVTLLLVALCLGIIKLFNKPRLTTVNGGNFEDEIIYTDVRVM